MIVNHNNKKVLLSDEVIILWIGAVVIESS